MRRLGLSLVTLLAAGSLLASPVMAKRAHVVPCKQIKDAIAAGKSQDDVAKDLKTTAAHVKACTSPAPAKKHKGGKA